MVYILDRSFEGCENTDPELEHEPHVGVGMHHILECLQSCEGTVGFVVVGMRRWQKPLARRFGGRNSGTQRVRGGAVEDD
jgi:hypothetical protein